MHAATQEAASRATSIYSKRSEAGRIVERLRALNSTALPPPDAEFDRWGIGRIAKTIEVLRRWLPPGSAAMDVASGARFSYLVTAALPGVVWQPTDVTDEIAEFCNSNGETIYTYQPIKFLLGPGRLELPCDSPLDAVTLFEVVEHLPWNPSEFFGSVCEALKPGGLFILSTPNITSRTAMLRLLGGGSAHQTPLLEEGLWYHRKEYAPWELRQLLEWAGFAVESISTSNCYHSDPRGWKALVHHACLLLAAGLSFDAVEIRNLLRYSGSTQFIVARRVGTPKWSQPVFRV